MHLCWHIGYGFSSSSEPKMDVFAKFSCIFQTSYQRRRMKEFLPFLNFAISRWSRVTTQKLLQSSVRGAFSISQNISVLILLSFCWFRFLSLFVYYVQKTEFVKPSTNKIFGMKLPKTPASFKKCLFCQVSKSKQSTKTKTRLCIWKTFSVKK